MTLPPASFLWVIGLFFIFNVHALLSSVFVRSPSQWAASVGACVLTEALARRLRAGAWQVPYSGLINGMALLLLCDSPYVWPYAAVGAVSILGKHLFRPDGRHVFNPTNLGMLVGLLFLSEWMTYEPARWNFGPAGLGVFMALGAYVAWKAERLSLSAAFAGTFIIGAFVRAHFLGVPAIVPLAPSFGAALHLFVFFNLTDPMTTPSSLRGKLAFGAGIAVLDALLRHGEYRFAPLLALFIACALRPAFDVLALRLQRARADASMSTSG